VDLFQSIYRHGGASHTIGRIVEPWDGAFLKLAQRRRLVDRFATRGTRLSDLPEEGPESEPQGPTAATRMRALVLLGKEKLRKPLVEEDLELMQERSGMMIVTGTKPTQVTVEVRTPGGEIRSHRTV